MENSQTADIRLPGMSQVSQLLNTNNGTAAVNNNLGVNQKPTMLTNL